VLIDGMAVEEYVSAAPALLAGGEGRDLAPRGHFRAHGVARALQVPLIRDGAVVHDPSFGEIRDHHRSAVRELGERAAELRVGRPFLDATPLARHAEHDAITKDEAR
jgi:hypothetical protein